MNNRLKYSFPNEEKATELIKALVSDEENTMDIYNVWVTEHTYGLHCIGFTDITETNEETSETILIKKGESFDVDVDWRAEQLEAWEKFRVTPKSPNHTWA